MSERLTRERVEALLPYAEIKAGLEDEHSEGVVAVLRGWLAQEEALRRIAELGEPISPPGALRQCDFIKEQARAVLGVGTTDE